jgi:hypothetical protein
MSRALFAICLDQRSHSEAGNNTAEYQMALLINGEALSDTVNGWRPFMDDVACVSRERRQ